MSVTRSSYGFGTRVAMSHERAVERVTELLKEEGFGVLTTIDVSATLRQKLGVEFRRYVILGACNPHLAHRAFQAELEIGLLLPCNVIVYEEGEGARVAVMDPDAALGVAPNPALRPVAKEARERLERVVEALAAQR
uniref:DUF302 domain-containing protein n=1 Tax=Eiseniibacteriota bacterium TaxID=2212470 RepID=A0A832MKE6_UNCEI